MISYFQERSFPAPLPLGIISAIVKEWHSGQAMGVGKNPSVTTGSSSSQGHVSPLFPFPHPEYAFTRESRSPAGLRGMEKKAFQCHSSVSRACLVALFTNHCAALGVRTSRISHCGKTA